MTNCIYFFGMRPAYSKLLDAAAYQKIKIQLQRAILAAPQG